MGLGAFGFRFRIPQSAFRNFNTIKKLSIEEIASAIGAPEEVEMVFKLMEHAAANMDHPIKKIPVKPPSLSRYQYVPGGGT